MGWKEHVSKCHICFLLVFVCLSILASIYGGVIIAWLGLVSIDGLHSHFFTMVAKSYFQGVRVSN